jgi:hypothetical protein
MEKPIGKLYSVIRNSRCRCQAVADNGVAVKSAISVFARGLDKAAARDMARAMNREDSITRRGN